MFKEERFDSRSGSKREFSLILGYECTDSGFVVHSHVALKTVSSLDIFESLAFATNREKEHTAIHCEPEPSSPHWFEATVAIRMMLRKEEEETYTYTATMSLSLFHTDHTMSRFWPLVRERAERGRSM